MPELSELEKKAYKALLKREATYGKAVAQELNNALKDIRKNLSTLYEKYSKDGKLSKADLTRYNRYTMMEEQILKSVGEATKKNVKIIDRLTPDQYSEAFFHEAWAIDNASGLRLNWGTINKEAVMENLDNEYRKISLERYGPDARLAVKYAINKGLVLGKTYEDMVRDLKKALNTTYNKSLRIIRTEGISTINAGTSDAYLRAKANGVDLEEVWDATHDFRTRPDHGHMDGKVKQSDGFFDGPGGERAMYPGWEGLSAAQRINCRCHERAQIKGYSPQLMRTREQGVIPYEDYDIWKKGLSKSKKKRNSVEKKKSIKEGSEASGNVPVFLQSIFNYNKANVPKEKYIAELIDAYGDKYKDDIIKTANDIEDYVNNGFVGQRIPTNVIDDLIASEGRMKSLFETGTGMGSTSTTARTNWESVITGGQKEGSELTVGSVKLLNKDRPIYGMVFDKEGKSIAEDNAVGYGRIIARYPDSIKNRCTFTLGNSSDEQGAFTIRNPAAAIKKQDSNIYYEYGSPLSGAKSYMASIKKSSEYMEVQMWGGVNIKDAEEILVPKAFSDQKEFLSNLKKLTPNAKITFYGD